MCAILKIKHDSPVTSSSSTPKPKRRENVLHVRLPEEEIEKLDALARENNITRAAVVAIACARIIKTGI